MDPEDDKQVTTFKKTTVSFTRGSVSPPPLKVIMRLQKREKKRLKVLHEMDQLCQSERSAIDVPIIEDNEKYDEDETQLLPNYMMS